MKILSILLISILLIITFATYSKISKEEENVNEIFNTIINYYNAIIKNISMTVGLSEYIIRIIFYVIIARFLYIIFLK